LAEDLGNLLANNTQSEITAKLSDPELPGAFLNSVNPPLTGKEGQITAVIAKARYVATENLAHRSLEHSPSHRTSNTVIKILLDSGLDGDRMFHEKGPTIHFP
jgi:hypothetical protein